MRKTRLSKEIKKWIKDFEKASSGDVLSSKMPNHDPLSFEGSAYNLLCRIYNLINKEKI